MELDKKHIIEYAVLGIILILFLGFFWYFRFDKTALLVVSAIGSIFYSAWGILHHAIQERLTRLIAIEYILFGFLVFLLFFFVIIL